MTQKTFANRNSLDGQFETVTTVEFSCPCCHRPIRVCVPQESPLINFKEEAKFWRKKAEDLSFRLASMEQIQRCNMGFRS